MNPTTCQACGSSDRIALSDERWLCAKCHPPMACPKCGTVCAAVGVERFAIGGASSNTWYALAQNIGFRCRSSVHGEWGYLFVGEGHMGPAWEGWTK